MPRKTKSTRPIDQLISRSQRDLRSSFAVVAKTRANVWVTVAAVCFVIGIAASFVAVNNKARKSEAAFLTRGSVTTSKQTTPVTDKSSTQTSNFKTASATSGSSSFSSIIRSIVDGSALTKTAATIAKSVSPSPADYYTVGDAATEQGGDCSFQNKAACVINLSGPGSLVQGSAGVFDVHGTPQKDVPCPGDPTCWRTLVIWPSITVDWGDGTLQSSNIRTLYNHTYLNPGSYTITATARYIEQQYLHFYNDDGTVKDNIERNIPEPFTISATPITVNVSAAATAPLTATLSDDSPGDTFINQNSTGVEFAKVAVTNPTNTAKVINALIPGCVNMYIPPRTDGLANPWPFGKYLSVYKGGAKVGQALFVNNGRQLGAEFSNANFPIDPLLRFKCGLGGIKLTAKAGSAITIGANQTVTFSIRADVGAAPPCSEFSLGLINAATAGTGLSIGSPPVMGAKFTVRGTNPFIHKSCGGSR